MDLHALQAGYMLREYKIISLLGEGGFGLTYLAFDTHLEKNVAIKEYLPGEHAVRTQDSQIASKSGSAKKIYQWGLKAFLNEAKILAKFEHPNIVRVFRFFQANGSAYIVMEYCQGGCLTDQVKKTHPMQESTLKSILAPIVEGLSQVHEHGILHRDIKPDNIVFKKDGSPVLIDFGAARQAMGDKSRTLTTIITPGYAPLEQYTSDGSIGPWSDIYSLAAVSYLCLTGEKPPDIMNRLNDDTIIKLSKNSEPSAFLAAIDAGLALQTNDRPQTLAQWSSSWMDITTGTKNSNNTLPIYAQKSNPIDLETTHSEPISVRKSLEQKSKTIVNTLDIDNKHSKKPLFKGFMLFLLIVGLLLFVDWQFNHKKIINTTINQWHALTSREPASNPMPSTPDRQAILKTQQALNKIGYSTTESGTLDQQTITNIKNFERQNNWLVTGDIDEQLLAHLQHHYKLMDEQAWQKAQQNNSVQSYQSYIDNYSDGQFKSQALHHIKSKSQKTTSDKESVLAQQNQDAQRLKEIALAKKQLVSDIQTELARLNFAGLESHGIMDTMTTDAIMSYQKLQKQEITGLPTKTLLFQLKSEQQWPDKKTQDTEKTCQHCPTMIVIPSGQFMMGSDKGHDNEKPVHLVKVNEFMLSETEITFQQWDECHRQGGCAHQPDDQSTGRVDQAVMHVNWYDAQTYIQWLNKTTGKKYRLPTESEWEYATRAGATTAYSWGDEVGMNNANCSGCQPQASAINQVKNFAANAFGLYDMHGNLWEWTQDCWHANYIGAPLEGQAWEQVDCDNFVVRGGSGGNQPNEIRSASRGFMPADKRLNSLGFRVALD